MNMASLSLYTIFSIVVWKFEQYAAMDLPCVTEAPVEGWVLAGHVMKTREGTTLSRCTFYCEIEHGCLSSNFILASHTCELNTATKEMFPLDFTKKENSLYIRNVLRERADPCASLKCQNNGRCLSPSGQQPECICPPGFTGSRCEVNLINGQALGMESKEIVDNNILSSSYAGTAFPWEGRLNSGSGWIAKSTDRDQWLGVSFQQTVVLLSQIATQGSPSNLCWVTQYTLSYYDPVYNQWKNYEETGYKKVFKGNTDQNTIVKNDINTPFKTTYIRVKPDAWYNQICLRLELYGELQ